MVLKHLAHVNAVEKSLNMNREEIKQTLHACGSVIIKDVLSTDEIAAIKAELQPYIDSGKSDADNAFMGDKIVRFGALLRKSPAVRKLALNEVVNQACKDILGPYSPAHQIHYTGVMHVQEGAKAQVLHRDVSPFPNPGPTVVLATMWAIEDFKKENGATVFVPGSHHWHDALTPQKHELRVAEMKAGSVLIYTGNLIHGSGKCEAGTRTGVSLQYSVSWLRQEENQYLAVPLNMVKDFPAELQKLMGYDLAAEHWGYVDQQHPQDFLKHNDKLGGLNPEGYELTGKIKALYVQENGYHLGHRYPVTLD